MRRLVALLSLCVVALWSALSAAAPVVLWHAYRGDEERALAQIVAGFPGQVELLSVPYDAFGSKLGAAIPLGEGPDVYIDAHERLGDYRQRGIVAEVGDALTSPEAFSRPALAATSGDGRVWGLPIGQKCVALYVNTDVVKDVPETLEGIGRLTGTLPEGVFPLAYEAKNTYAHAPILHAFGGRLLGDKDAFGFVGPEAEASLGLVLDLLAKRAVPEDADGALVTNLFRSGKAAFAISGPWLAADLGAAAGLHYKVVPLPRVEATGQPLRPLLTVEAVMLSPTGATRPEARQLARWLAGPEAAAIRARVARTLPARLDVPLPEGDALLAAFSAQAQVSVPMSSSVAMRAVWEPANRALRKVLRRDADAKTALAEAAHRFADVRAELPSPRSPEPALVALGLTLLLVALHLVRRSRDPEFRGELRRSMPAYRYVVHAVLALVLLVFLPLGVGAATSLFSGHNRDLYYVGVVNFFDILTARGEDLLSTGSFYFVLLVTVLWTVMNLALHLGIGLALGLLLSRPALRLKAIYRVLLIIPWAVPSYVTALAWKGMFHRQFGAITGLILWVNQLFGTHLEPIAWFSRFSTAFAANLATNVWLGFPFMMVVTLGALTSVPEEVLEAAEVDGATRWQRLRLVTLPMIRPVLAPSVTLGAIWTFNMFNVVFLVSGGDPDGTTDILVTEAYRWAFTREAQYGYAAAYSVLIFLLLTFATRMGDGLKRARERREAAPALVKGAT